MAMVAKLNYIDSDESGGAPGAQPENGDQPKLSWDFKVKVEEAGRGAQAGEGAEQRQESKEEES